MEKSIHKLKGEYVFKSVREKKLTALISLQSFLRH